MMLQMYRINDQIFNRSEPSETMSMSENLKELKNTIKEIQKRVSPSEPLFLSRLLHVHATIQGSGTGQLWATGAQFPTATTCVNQLLEADLATDNPVGPYVYDKIARYYNKTRRFSEERSILEQGLKKYPNYPPLVQSKIRRIYYEARHKGVGNCLSGLPPFKSRVAYNQCIEECKRALSCPESRAQCLDAVPL